MRLASTERREEMVNVETQGVEHEGWRNDIPQNYECDLGFVNERITADSSL